MHYAAVTADRLKIRLHDCVGFFTTILLIQNIQRNNDIQRLRGSQIIQREMLQQYKNLTFSKKTLKEKTSLPPILTSSTAALKWRFRLSDDLLQENSAAGTRVQTAGINGTQ